MADIPGDCMLWTCKTCSFTEYTACKDYVDPDICDRHGNQMIFPDEKTD